MKLGGIEKDILKKTGFFSGGMIVIILLAMLCSFVTVSTGLIAVAIIVGCAALGLGFWYFILRWLRNKL